MKKGRLWRPWMNHPDQIKDAVSLARGPGDGIAMRRSSDSKKTVMLKRIAVTGVLQDEVAGRTNRLPGRSSPPAPISRGHRLAPDANPAINIRDRVRSFFHEDHSRYVKPVTFRDGRRAWQWRVGHGSSLCLYRA